MIVLVFVFIVARCSVPYLIDFHMVDFDRSYNSSIADHIPLLACV